MQGAHEVDQVSHSRFLAEAKLNWMGRTVRKCVNTVKPGPSAEATKVIFLHQEYPKKTFKKKLNHVLKSYLKASLRFFLV